MIDPASPILSAEVRPQLLSHFRNSINLDKERIFSPILYKSNFFVDGFADSDMVASSTNWSVVGKTYFTGTNSAELISKSVKFASTISFGTAYVDYEIMETIDEFNDSSINTSLWDTGHSATHTDNGSVTEDTDTINILASGHYTGGSTSASAYLQSDNAVLDATNNYVAFKFTIATATGNGNSTNTNTFSVILTDGTNTATCFSVAKNSTTGTYTEQKYSNNNFSTIYDVTLGMKPFGDSFSGDHLIELFYDSSAEIVLVYYDGLFYDRVSVSSIGAIKIRLQTDGGCSGNTNDVTVITQVDVDWIRRNKASPASSLATTISANNGTNYEATTREYEHTFSNTGTEAKIKNVVTISGSEFIHIRGIGAFVR
jgi:hypothetical protein